MAEIIQTKSGRGGRRPGAGRKAGSCNAKTREIADRAAENGITPLEFMLEVLRDATLDRETRMDAAKSAAPYIHPRLSATEVSGSKENPLVVETIRREVIDAGH